MEERPVISANAAQVESNEVPPAEIDGVRVSVKNLSIKKKVEPRMGDKRAKLHESSAETNPSNNKYSSDREKDGTVFVGNVWDKKRTISLASPPKRTKKEIEVVNSPLPLTPDPHPKKEEIVQSINENYYTN